MSTKRFFGGRAMRWVSVVLCLMLVASPLGAMGASIEEPIMHTVYYDNGMSSVQLTDTVAEGEPIDLVTKFAERAGHLFLGWNTDKSATAGLASLIMGTADVTLHAIYEPITHAVYYYNGAQLVHEDNVAEGAPIDLSPTAEKAGHTFLGWNTNSEFSEGLSGIDMEYNGTDVVLYAIFEPNDEPITHRVYYYPGSDVNWAVDVAEGAAIDLNVSAAKAGHTFLGWNTDKSAAAGLAMLTMGTEDVTLYAIFAPIISPTDPPVIRHKVRYYDGDELLQEATVSEGMAIDLSVTAPKRSGHSFQGWHTNSTAKEGLTGLTMGNADVALYAVHKPHTYIVYYYYQGQGGSERKDTKYVQTGRAVDLAYVGREEASRDALLGWNTSQSAREPLSSLVMGTKSIELYAVYASDSGPMVDQEADEGGVLPYGGEGSTFANGAIVYTDTLKDMIDEATDDYIHINLSTQPILIKVSLPTDGLKLVADAELGLSIQFAVGAGEANDALGDGTVAMASNDVGVAFATGAIGGGAAADGAGAAGAAAAGGAAAGGGAGAAAGGGGASGGSGGAASGGGASGGGGGGGASGGGGGGGSSPSVSGTSSESSPSVSAALTSSHPNDQDVVLPLWDYKHINAEDDLLNAVPTLGTDTARWPTATLTLDPEALQSITAAAGDVLTFGFDELSLWERPASEEGAGTYQNYWQPSDIRKYLDDAFSELQADDLTVYDITISNGDEEIHTFEGSISAIIPYAGDTLPAVFSLDAAGNLERIESVAFVAAPGVRAETLDMDAGNGYIKFEPQHFSLFIIAPDPAVWENPYTDVQPADAYYGDVAFVAAHDPALMDGTSATTFSPDAEMTRAAFAEALDRLSGSPEGSGQPESDAPIARQDAAAMLLQYAKDRGLGPVGAWAVHVPFSDFADTADGAGEAVMWCYMKGILAGNPDNTLDPAGIITRADAAAMLRLFATKVVEMQ
ncbi:MAG: InlB B-repeat-containing protein [Oscillospiraceae bacterium]|jgi:uncharacterized repeat protein (TIGR02543 family)|nr:InlB B-repeat-containing protein [Oscillospiraceae bacterium]